MSFETLIPFVIKHNAVIIQALVAAILLLVAVLAVRNFLRAGDAAAGPAVGAASLEQLEGTLKKLLERAGQVPAVPANSESAPLVAEIESLRASLAEKQDQIEQLKLAPVPEGAPVGDAAPAPAAVAGLSSAEKGVLEEQIRDLQAKLAEYEIISEDIADLSFYKEENVKLQKQLDSLKEGGAPAPAAPAAAPAPAPEAPAPAAAEAPAPPAADPAVDPAQAMVDSLMATPVEELAQAQAAETPERNAAADEDLLKEFADAVSAQGGTPSVAEAGAEEADPAAAGLFDVERMTQEAGQLEKIAATVGDAAEAALEADLDAERLAAEAASMENIKPEDAKLMGDFEEFMKKGGA